MSKFDKVASPCIDICEDLHKRCIACGRSKHDKKAWKRADSREEKLLLIRQCLEMTRQIGTQELWVREYRYKCRKKGVECPLDEIMATAEE